MDWTQILIVVIQLIIAPLLVWGIKEAVSFLKVKTLAVENEAYRKILQDYIDRAAAAIQTAVIETQQVFVDSIKHTEGWNSAAMQEAFTRAAERAKAIMGTAVYDGLTEAVGDVNKWITARIEQTVHETKFTTPLQEVTVNEIKSD